MNSLLDEGTRQKLFTNLDICFKKSDGLPSIIYPVDNKVSLFSIFFLKLLFFFNYRKYYLILFFSAMARCSIGPKLIWASPNCFGHGSKFSMKKTFWSGPKLIGPGWFWALKPIFSSKFFVIKSFSCLSSY